MTRANLHHQLTQPQGRVFGWGTTVGLGQENWAPGAIFIDTDASQGSQVYVNTGSKTTAAWTEIADSGVAGGFALTGTAAISGTGRILLQDSVEIDFGTGGDLRLEHDGTTMNSGPTTGLWAGCPTDLDPDPFKGRIIVYDDFNRGGTSATAPLPLWDAVTGSGGTNAFRTDTTGGIVNLVTDTTDNDYHALATVGTPFDLVSAKPLWFEARYRLSEAATNESAIWFGLTSSLTTGGLQANALGPLGTYDGVLIWKDEASMACLSETSNDTTQATNTTMGTVVSNTWTRLGFYVDGTATTATVTFYTDIAVPGTLAAFGTTKTITRAGLVPMYMVGGVKAGPSGNAETLQIDYMKCVQVR